jgi:hypothetical protein
LNLERIEPEHIGASAEEQYKRRNNTRGGTIYKERNKIQEEEQYTRRNKQKEQGSTVVLARTIPRKEITRR